MRDSIETEKIKKYFKIEEAEKHLPKIEKLLRRLMHLDRAIELLDTVEIEVEEEDYACLRHITRLNKEFHKLSYEFYEKLDEIESLGCIIKDIELGLVDFYYRFENRDIFLCWKLGEKEIRYWHEAYDGFEGRKPILNLAKK